MSIYIYYRQTYQSSSINKKTADAITFKKLEEKVVLESDNVQNESQINEDEDNFAIFDAPQKKDISKPIESNNCSKVGEEAKPEDKRKSVESNRIEHNANQIIEDEHSPIMDLNECVGDVSCLFIILFYYS